MKSLGIILEINIKAKTNIFENPKSYAIAILLRRNNIIMATVSRRSLKA